MEKFPERLRALRNKQGRSQVVASELCGLNVTAFYKYESGKVMPSVEHLIVLADYFGVSTDYLLGRDNP